MASGLVDDVVGGLRSRPMRVGESREAYVRRAAAFCRDAERRLHDASRVVRLDSSLVRDALLVVERVFCDLHTFGVERIDAGHGRRSPAITYLNSGDTYDCTVLYVNGRYRAGCWGDIVERGRYD
jgi:hypothetical protein